MPPFQTTEVLQRNLRATKIPRSNDSELINITIVTEGITTFQSSGNVYDMAELFEPEVRIYVLNMYPRHARRIMCKVSHGKSVLLVHLSYRSALFPGSPIFSYNIEKL